MVPHIAARKTHQRLREFSLPPQKDFCNNIGQWGDLRALPEASWGQQLVISNYRSRLACMEVAHGNAAPGLL